MLASDRAKINYKTGLLLPSLLFFLTQVARCSVPPTIRIGAILAEDTVIDYSRLVEIVRTAAAEITFKNFTFTVRPYYVQDGDSESRIREIHCDMVKDDIYAFVSTVTEAKLNRFLIDLARATNILHIVAATRINNLYQAKMHVSKPFMPLIFSDYDSNILNDLLKNYLSVEYFKWRRAIILYEHSYGLDCLQDFIEHSRHLQRKLTTIELPSAEVNGFDETWRRIVSDNIFNSATAYEEHYLIIHASFEYANALLSVAWKRGMTKPSYFYLITTPVSHVHEMQEITTLLSGIDEKPNVLFIHRTSNSSNDNYVQQTLRSGTQFLLEFLANYTDAIGSSENSSALWPIDRTDEISDCFAANNNLTEMESKRLNFSTILTAAGANVTECHKISAKLTQTNCFQKHFEMSKYSPKLRNMSIIDISFDGTNSTHRTVYPCTNCEERRSLRRSVIRVAAYLDEPCIIPNRRTFERFRPFDGFCVELLESVARHYKIDLVWSYVHDNVTGRLDDNLGWNGVIKMLIDNNADVAGNLIEVDSIRAQYLDFSQPILIGTFEALVQQPSKVAFDTMAFMEPFSTTLWAAVLLAIIFCSLVLWVTSKLVLWAQSENCCATCRRCGKSKSQANVGQDSGLTNQLKKVAANYDRFTRGQSLWYTTGAFFKQDSGTEPKSFSSKLLSTFIAVFTVIIVACYTANLTAFLALERRSPEIRSIDDLAQSDIPLRILDSSAIGSYLKRMKRMKTYGTIWNAVKGYPKEAGFIKSTQQGVALAKSGAAAWIGDSSLIRYWLTKRECAEPNSMTIIGKPFGSHALAFAFRKNSDIRDSFAAALLNILESDHFEQRKKEAYDPPAECELENELIQEVSLRQTGRLTAVEVQGVFLVLFGGISIALLFAFMHTVSLWVVRFRLKRLSARQKTQDAEMVGNEAAASSTASATTSKM